MPRIDNINSIIIIKFTVMINYYMGLNVTKVDKILVKKIEENKEPLGQLLLGIVHCTLFTTPTLITSSVGYIMLGISDLLQAGSERSNTVHLCSKQAPASKKFTTLQLTRNTNQKYNKTRGQVTINFVPRHTYGQLLAKSYQSAAVNFTTLIFLLATTTYKTLKSTTVKSVYKGQHWGLSTWPLQRDGLQKKVIEN